MCHSVYNNLSTEKHYSFFQVLTIKNFCAGFYVNISFQLIWRRKYQGVQLLDHVERVHFCKNLTKCLLKYLYHLIVPRAVRVTVPHPQLHLVLLLFWILAILKMHNGILFLFQFPNEMYI